MILKYPLFPTKLKSPHLPSHLFFSFKKIPSTGNTVNAGYFSRRRETSQEMMVAISQNSTADMIIVERCGEGSDDGRGRDIFSPSIKSVAKVRVII